MTITREDILHLAQLSNLSIEEAEIDSLKTDLTNIINFISQLDQLDVTGIEPTYQVSGLTNVWRPDEIAPLEADRDQLLALAPQTLDHQVKVPKIL